MYGQPERFPSDEPDRLWILVAGRTLSRAEEERWRRVLVGKRKTLPLITFILALFLILGVFVDRDYTVWYEALVKLALFFFGMIGAVWSFCGVLRVSRKGIDALYEEQDADVKANAMGSRIAFHGDRLVHTTLRGTIVLPYTEIQSCVETADGFALNDGTQLLILRGQDLTAFDADLIRAYLQERLPRQVIRIKAPVIPFLQAPLPFCGMQT